MSSQSEGTTPKRNATLEEVAQAAGASRATVSRVVNGSPRVSPNVRRSVERAVAQLGYVPNRAARSLVMRRSDSIGIVIPDRASRFFSDPFFPQLLRGISQAVVARGLQLVLLMPQSDEEEKRLEQYLSAGHVDGVVLIGLHADDLLPARLAAHGIPTVMSGRPLEDVRVSYVDVDNRQGARLAVEHLLAGGRRRIATITGALDMTGATDRLLGYRDALTDAGMRLDPSLEEVGDFSQETAARAMALLLKRHPGLDGLFVASDSMAVAALRVLKDAGRRVPDDTAVVGFDDQPIARTANPPLSSIQQPIETMTGEMIRLLLEGINTRDRVPRQVIFPTRLVVRASSGGTSTPSS